MQPLLAYMLNAGWQLSLVAAGAWVLSRLLKPAPADGSRLWLAAFALAVLAPVAAMVLNRAAPEAGSVLPKLSLARDVEIPSWAALALESVFWICLAVAALRLAAGAIAARRVLARSQDLVLTDGLRETLGGFCSQHHHPLPQIRACADITSPLVTGVWRPTILVPPAVAEQGDEALRAALLHELAHVVRRDHAANLAVELFALPLTWHPALHLLKAMIRLTREQSCDAMAAAQIGCRHLYASTLLSLARRAIAPKLQAAVGMFGDGDLSSRIAALASRTPPRAPRLAGAAVACTLLALAAAVTAVHLSPLMPAPVQPIIARSRPAVVTAPVQVAVVEPARPQARRRRVRSDRMIGLSDQRSRVRPDAVALAAPEAATDASGGMFDFLLPLTGRYRTIAP